MALGYHGLDQRGRDFGGQAGHLTPDWWGVHSTQYGLLKLWQLDATGTKIDGVWISDVTIDALRLLEAPYIAVRIGIKPDATHVGGLNLFGSQFGNYPQDLVLRMSYGSANGRPARQY
jgi:predicted transcriptional regulator